MLIFVFLSVTDEVDLFHNVKLHGKQIKGLIGLRVFLSL